MAALPVEGHIMPDNTYNDLVIIGAGPAGLTAAIYASRAGLDAVVLEQGAWGGQIATTPEVDNYPGLNDISGSELGERMHAHAEQLGARFDYDVVSSVAVDADGLFTVTGDETTRTCRSVIYAAGATPRKAGFEGEDAFRGRGVSYCATCDGMFYRGKHVYVIGGGNSASEEAVYLSRFASDVTLVVRKDHLRAVQSLRRQVEASDKITVAYNTTVVSVAGEGVPSRIALMNRVTGETCVNELGAGTFGVFVSVGSVAQIQPIASLVDTTPDGSVITADDMSTRTRGLFVAGDTRSKPLRQVITAAADGAIAANSAAMYLGELVI